MSEVVVVAEIGIAVEKREEALDALRVLLDETHAKDEGCLLYALQLDPADESHVFMVEKWASPEALQAHTETDHIKGFLESGVLSGVLTMTVLQQAGFGDSVKGSL
jgi:quinol monooxygenase YgiN